MQDFRIPPEYRPTEKDTDTSIGVIDIDNKSYILDMDVPTDTIFKGVVATDGRAIPMSVSDDRLGVLDVKWIDDAVIYKLIYTTDSRTFSEGITQTKNYKINYDTKVEIVYVWLGYMDKNSTEYIFDKRNAKAIFIQHTNSTTREHIDVNINPLDKSTALNHLDVTGVNYHIHIEYIKSGLVKLTWLNQDNSARTLLKYNEYGQNPDKEKTYFLKPSINSIILPLKENTAYDVYISNEVKGQFNNGQLVRIYYTIGTDGAVTTKIDEVSNIYNGKIFQDKGILAEVIKLFNYIVGTVEAEKYHKQDEYSFNREMASYTDSVYQIKDVELIKPSNVFKGTIRDRNYLQSLADGFSMRIYKSSKVPEELKYISEFGEFLDEIAEIICDEGKYNNASPKRMNNISPELYDNNREKCEYDFIPKKNCQFDIIAEADLTDPFLKATDTGIIAQKAKDLFRERMWVCLSIRLITVIYKIAEKYEYPVEEVLDAFEELLFEDDFNELYQTLKYRPDNKVKFGNTNEYRFNNTILDDTRWEYTEENTFSQNFIDINPEHVYDNYVLLYYNNKNPKRFRNYNPPYKFINYINKNYIYRGADYDNANPIKYTGDTIMDAYRESQDLEHSSIYDLEVKDEHSNFDITNEFHDYFGSTALYSKRGIRYAGAFYMNTDVKDVLEWSAIDEYGLKTDIEYLDSRCYDKWGNRPDLPPSTGTLRVDSSVEYEGVLDLTHETIKVE